MAMSDLKQRIYKQELAKIGFPSAEYMQGSGKIKIEPKNDRMPDINNDGDIHYGTEHDQLVKDTIRPMVDRVNEITAAWEHSRPVPIENLSRFNILTEFNNIVLAARNDSKHGLHFAVWKYDTDRTGFHTGHYTDDYVDAKENFTLRAGLIQKEKIVTKEVAEDISAAIEEYVVNSADVYFHFEREERLNGFNDGLYSTYPAIFEGRTPARYEYPQEEAEEEQADKQSAEEPTKKPAKQPKTLQEKLDNAKQKAAQADAQKTMRGDKTKKPGERE